MFDIEAFGQDFPVQIGAVEFSAHEVFEKINLRIEPTTVKGTIDPNTVMWWLEQSDKARSTVYQREGLISLARAARQLKDFYAAIQNTNRIAGYDRVPVWSHATYDPVVLERGFRGVGASTPWTFRDARDLRTLYGLDPDVTSLAYKRWNNIYGSDGDHTALADAEKQVYVWQQVVTALNIRPQ